MKKIFLAAAVMFLGVSAFSQQTNNLLHPYIMVKDAFVKSDSKAAATEIASLNEAVKAEKDFAQKADLQKATEKLAKAGENLDKQRAAFNDVSTIIWKIVKTSDVRENVYYQYCPMKKAYWLSREKEIKNPYYGSSMLTCGKVVETK